MLPFSIGALIYFTRHRVRESMAYGLAIIGGAVWIVNLASMSTETAAARAITYSVGFYLNLVALSAIIAGLAAFRRNRIDDYFGELSYPIFLVHWQVAVVMVIALGLVPHGIAAFAWSLPIAVLVAMFLNQLLNMTIRPLRSQIRPAQPQESIHTPFPSVKSSAQRDQHASYAPEFRM